MAGATKAEPEPLGRAVGSDPTDAKGGVGVFQTSAPASASMRLLTAHHHPIATTSPVAA